MESGTYVMHLILTLLFVASVPEAEPLRNNYYQKHSNFNLRTESYIQDPVVETILEERNINLIPEEDQRTSKESEEVTRTDYVTTSKISKVKRSKNVIEEENVGSTVSAYKFTWRDTRLTDNLVYKNIHS